MKNELLTDETIVQDWIFTINESREALNKHFKVFRIVNLVLMLLILAIITVGFTVLFPMGELGMGLAVASIVVALILVFIYSTYMKKFTTKKGNEYIALYYNKISDYVFGDLPISNYVQDVQNTLTFEDFANAKLLKEVNSSGSRNLVTYDYKGHSIKLADYGAYKQEGKLNRVLFVGKLIIIEDIKSIGERVIVYRRPVQEQLSKSTGPNDVDELEVAIDDEQIKVYSQGDFDKTKTKQILALIRDFPTDLPFIDASFAFVGSKLTIALSYSDDLMVIPLPEPFKKEANDVFKANIQAIHKIIDLL